MKLVLINGRPGSGKTTFAHPGHAALNRMDDFNSSDKFEPIDLGRVIKIDTTDFAKVDYEQLISDLK